MDTVMVTGSFGFIGRHIVGRLTGAGNRVISYKITKSGGSRREGARSRGRAGDDGAAH